MFRLDCSPAFSSSCNFQPLKKQKKSNYVIFLHQEDKLITVLHVWTLDVFKNKVKKGLEVGVAVCETDVSAMAEEQCEDSVFK